MCGDVSYISEGTYLGLDLRDDSPILSIGENAPSVPIKQSSEKFEVHGYRGKQDPPEILERGTYAAAHDIQTGVNIVLVCQNGIGRKNHGNLLLLMPFRMREAGWEVRDVKLPYCTEDRDPN